MKKLILFFKWLFDKTEPRSCTFETYLEKVKMWEKIGRAGRVKNRKGYEI